MLVIRVNTKLELQQNKRVYLICSQLKGRLNIMATYPNTLQIPSASPQKRGKATLLIISEHRVSFITNIANISWTLSSLFHHRFSVTLSFWSLVCLCYYISSLFSSVKFVILKCLFEECPLSLYSEHRDYLLSYQIFSLILFRHWFLIISLPSELLPFM